MVQWMLWIQWIFMNGPFIKIHIDILKTNSGIFNGESTENVKVKQTVKLQQENVNIKTKHIDFFLFV